MCSPLPALTCLSLLVLRHKTVYSTRAPSASSRNRVTQQHFQLPDLAESVASHAAPEAAAVTADRLEVVERPADPTRPSGARLSRPSAMLEPKRPDWYKEEMKSNHPIRAARPAPARRVSESMFRKPSGDTDDEAQAAVEEEVEGEEDDAQAQAQASAEAEAEAGPADEAEGSVAASHQEVLGSSRRSDIV